jgi:hypothetical protein
VDEILTEKRIWDVKEPVIVKIKLIISLRRGGFRVLSLFSSLFSIIMTSLRQAQDKPFGIIINSVNLLF